jgi:predicted DNA-binding transcriptional regulator YafY
MAKTSDRDETNGIASHRASRLYKLVTLIGEKAKTRETLLRKLKIDVRCFYRDLEFLRLLGIAIATTAGEYHLGGSLEDALGRIPFPDPCFSVRDAIQLVNGSAAVKKKLKKKLESVIGGSSA